jgi:hypothetical protein
MKWLSHQHNISVSNMGQDVYSLSKHMSMMIYVTVVELSIANDINKLTNILLFDKLPSK